MAIAPAVAAKTDACCWRSDDITLSSHQRPFDGRRPQAVLVMGRYAFCGQKRYKYEGSHATLQLADRASLPPARNWTTTGICMLTGYSGKPRCYRAGCAYSTAKQSRQKSLKPGERTPLGSDIVLVDICDVSSESNRQHR